MAIKKMGLEQAKAYLEDVIAMRCVVFRRFCGGAGRTAQAKNEGSTNGQAGGPKSAEMLLGILKNAESNAEVRYSSLSLSAPSGIFYRWSGTVGGRGRAGRRSFASSKDSRVISCDH